MSAGDAGLLPDPDERRVRAVGHVAAVSLSPATDGVPETDTIVCQSGRKATREVECHALTDSFDDSTVAIIP